MSPVMRADRRDWSLARRARDPGRRQIEHTDRSRRSVRGTSQLGDLPRLHGPGYFRPLLPRVLGTSFAGLSRLSCRSQAPSPWRDSHRVRVVVLPSPMPSMTRRRSGHQRPEPARQASAAGPFTGGADSRCGRSHRYPGWLRSRPGWAGVHRWRTFPCGTRHSPGSGRPGAHTAANQGVTTETRPAAIECSDRPGTNPRSTAGWATTTSLGPSPISLILYCPPAAHKHTRQNCRSRTSAECTRRASPSDVGGDAQDGRHPPVGRRGRWPSRQHYAASRPERRLRSLTASRLGEARAMYPNGGSRTRPSASVDHRTSPADRPGLRWIGDLDEIRGVAPGMSPKPEWADRGVITALSSLGQPPP